MVTDGNTMVATRMMADAKSMATMMVGDNIMAMTLMILDGSPMVTRAGAQ